MSDRGSGRDVVEPVRPAIDLPRAQTGTNPQHLILTILGDYWFGRREHLPSTALVTLAGEFGITPTSARAALSRLTRRGLLESSRRGRHTYYGLTGRAEQVLSEGLRRIMTFGLDDRPWDRSWLWVIFSVPESQREVRYQLRTRLRWLGFARLYDGAWVSPRADAERTTALLSEFGDTSATLLSCRVAYKGATGDPLRAWDLGALRSRYEAFIGEFRPLLVRAQEGLLPAPAAMVARTRVMDEWRQFPNLDPELPEAELPVRWPRREAREIFSQVYDSLEPLAVMHVHQVIQRYEPSLVVRGSHLTSSFSALAFALAWQAGNSEQFC